MNSNAIIQIKNLTVHYETEFEVVEAVNNVSFEIMRGETLGLVGETGAGKTTIALSILKLLNMPPGHIIAGSITFGGKDLLKANKMQMNRIRGNQISMIFQDPMTSLNPVLTIGEQVAEAIALHQKCSKVDANKRAIEVLNMVGIGTERFKDYPHQFSGGMKQRVVIATALSCRPSLLIADEPTTALDVTIQAQVLDMIRNLQKELGTSMLLITHDLGVVAETCNKVAVIYAGSIVEYGTIEQVFLEPKHPYTVGLFNSIPSITSEKEYLVPIKGLMPNPTALPTYCSFYDRCEKAMDICKVGEPKNTQLKGNHQVRCKLYEIERGDNKYDSNIRS